MANKGKQKKAGKGLRRKLFCDRRIPETDCFPGEVDMKFLKQFLIILTITVIGELVKMLLPLPIPASIYGMLILFICLMTGLIKPESVREAGNFLIEIMPVMFIPAGVGLMDAWGVLKPILFPVSLITVVSLIAVMAVTGRVSQWLIRREKGEDHD